MKAAGIFLTWTCYPVSRRSCCWWRHWCQCCRSSPGWVCHSYPLQQRVLCGAGWSDGPGEEQESCWAVRGSHAVPPTGTEPQLQPSVSARLDVAAAPRSPADLERERTGREECKRNQNGLIYKLGVRRYEKLTMMYWKNYVHHRICCSFAFWKVTASNTVAMQRI